MLESTCHLQKYEKETILLTSEGDDFYNIYTFSGRLKRKLNDYAEKYPEYCRKIASTDEAIETFEIEKTRVSIRLLPPYPDELRKEASKRGKNSDLIKAWQNG